MSALTLGVWIYLVILPAALAAATLLSIVLGIRSSRLAARRRQEMFAPLLADVAAKVAHVQALAVQARSLAAEVLS